MTIFELRGLLRVAAGLVAATLGSSTAGAQQWQRAEPGYAWSFPADHWAHPGYRTEWWYFTGQLRSDDDPQRRFAYQFTFFRIGILPQAPALDSEWASTDLVMGHAALIDLDRGEHRFSECLRRATPFLAGFGQAPDPLLVWSRAPAGTDARWTLEWSGAGFDMVMRDERQGFALELQTLPDKPLVLQGPDGYSRKGRGPDAASLYYSFTRLRTRGSIEVDGERYTVEGTSWMDKEFGSNQLEPQQTGWDWFSLQLDDGRDLMLYSLRGADGSSDWALGTEIGAGGSTRQLGAEDWQAEPLGSWTSSGSGTTYPARWRIRLGDQEVLEVRPLLSDQENRSRLLPGLDYWEGAVEVFGPGGESLGRGFVELTGYGDSLRPAI